MDSTQNQSNSITQNKGAGMLLQYLEKEHLDTEGKLTSAQWSKFVYRFENAFINGATTEIGSEMFDFSKRR